MHDQAIYYLLSLHPIPTHCKWLHVPVYIAVGAAIGVLVPQQELTTYVAPFLEGEPAGGNKTYGSIGSWDTSLIFPVAWPP